MRSLFPPRLLFGAALCGCLLAPSLVRADAFSTIPVGDPIYRQLDALSIIADGKSPKTASNLTRYEAALQVARVAAVGAARPDSLSRIGWRNLRDLTNSLKPELAQLGVDVEEILTACNHQLDTPLRSPLPAPAPLPQRASKGRDNTSSSPLSSSFLGGGTSPAIAGLSRNTLDGTMSLPLLGRVRTEAALLALKRNTQDPFFDGQRGLYSRSSDSQVAGSDASVSVNLNSWLRVRALASQRQLNMEPDKSPTLSAPFFNGSTQAKGFGGGVEVSPMSWLHLSTEMEQLSTNAGTRGTRVGGGIGLSAWQNRLTMSAHMSRLQPGDSAALAATATELNLGVNMTQRLSLSLLYQNLFSGQSETSRLAGGFNLSF